MGEIEITHSHPNTKKAAMKKTKKLTGRTMQVYLTPSEKHKEDFLEIKTVEPSYKDVKYIVRWIRESKGGFKGEEDTTYKMYYLRKA